MIDFFLLSFFFVTQLRYADKFIVNIIKYTSKGTTC